MNDVGNLSFQKLDEQMGKSLLPESEEANEWPLEAWYRSVYKKAFNDFDALDLSRSCQQHIHLDYIVPYSLSVLEYEPLVGDWFDGQLLLALFGLSIRYWQMHPDQAKTLLEIASSTLSHPEHDVDDPELYSKLSQVSTDLEKHLVTT